MSDRLKQLDHLLNRCVETSSGCWEFTGRRDKFGYGRINAPTYGENLVHRFVWSHVVGEIPDGLVLDHLCVNPPCCNPYHIRPVPQRVNMLAGTHRSAVAHATGFCIRGHSLANAYVHPDRGRLQCRECRKVRRNEMKGTKV